jgi:hypothetical protein
VADDQVSLVDGWATPVGRVIQHPELHIASSIADELGAFVGGQPGPGVPSTFDQDQETGWREELDPAIESCRRIWHRPEDVSRENNVEGPCGERRSRGVRDGEYWPRNCPAPLFASSRNHLR